MNTRVVINIVKYVSAVAIGATIGAVAHPAVKNFFKLNNKEAEERVPSVDIAEEEIPENE